MRVHVKFFAIFREIIGIKSEWAEIGDGTTVEQLWTQYAARGKRPVKLRAAYAVNQRLARPDHVLQDGDEVGFLPPVSGGQAKRQNARGTKTAGATETAARRRATKTRRTSLKEVAITRKPLDLGSLVKCVEFPGAGAIVTFTGVVRDNAKGRAVDHLEYDAYPEMAEAVLRDIIGEIHDRWPDTRVAMAHRIGKLKIGEPSLITAVSAPHRPEAYAASRYAIERIKAVLPVWKKEFSEEGEYWVEGPIAGEVPPEKAERIVQEAEQQLGTKDSEYVADTQT